MTPKPPKFTGVAIVLILIVAALSVVDRALARIESTELHNTAQRSYLEGSRFLAAGKPADAIDPLREAHSVERQNAAYELALITALTDSGKTAEAEPLMDEMVQREPNDGEVNLIAARLAAHQGRATEAEAYYHRAIYGEWPNDPAQHRIATRMELIDKLMKRGQRQETLAELISLEAEPTASMEIQKRLAQLFLQIDAPGRAAGVYQEMISKDPKDIPAYVGLGEAELVQGQYSAARTAFLQAFFHDPNDASIRSHLQILNTVVGLDPTLRQLTSEEKYRRSIHILDMARTGLAACAPSNALVATADATLAAKTPTHVTNEAAESVLTLAEMVWRARNDACAGKVGEEDVLNLLMRKLAT